MIALPAELLLLFWTREIAVDGIDLLCDFVCRRKRYHRASFALTSERLLCGEGLPSANRPTGVDPFSVRASNLQGCVARLPRASDRIVMQDRYMQL